MTQLTATSYPKIVKASFVFHEHPVINNIIKGKLFIFEVSPTWKLK